MRTINPKCTNKDSFKYSILISLYYYDLNSHKERTNQWNKYLNNYNFDSNNYDTFENNSPFISLTVYDENGKLLHEKTFILPHSTFYNFYDFFCFVFNKWLIIKLFDIYTY